MSVTIVLRKESIQLEGEPTVWQVLDRLDLPADSYLAVRDGELLTEDLKLHDGDVVQLIAVISGGGR